VRSIRHSAACLHQVQAQAQADAQAASAAQIVRENAEALAAATAQHEAAVAAARAQIAAIAAVHAEWQEVADPSSGRNYYYRTSTQATQWEAPDLWVRARILQYFSARHACART
jgi:hypothetical protein